MIYNLQIKEEASLEIIEAFLYYEEQKTGLGEKFLVQLEKYLKILRETPFLYQTKSFSFREAYLIKFPYLIIFEVVSSEVIVYSVFNTSRNPDGKY